MMRFKSYTLRISIIVLFITFVCGKPLWAQDNKPEQLLLEQYRAATNDSEKVFRLYDLINFYYAYNNEAIADSLREKQLLLADEPETDGSRGDSRQPAAPGRAA